MVLSNLKIEQVPVTLDKMRALLQSLQFCVRVALTKIIFLSTTYTPKKPHIAPVTAPTIIGSRHRKIAI